MKVLMINVVCGIRSTGRICTDLATVLDKNGHEVRIAYGREDVPEKFQKYAVRIGSDFDIKLHGVKARLFDGCGRGSRKATKRFIEWVNEFNPDVIHLHNIHGYYINIEVLFNYLRTCGKRIIWTLHDCWAFTGHAAYCEAANCERWETGCFRCPKHKEYPSTLLDRSKKNWKEKKELIIGIPKMIIVTPSEWLRNLANRSFLGCNKVIIINNGIDTNKFHRVSEYDCIEFLTGNRIEIKNKKIILGVASIWNERKGLADFYSLNEKINHNNYCIILVGLTKNQIESLPDGIIGIERTNSVSELAVLYSSAYVFVNPTYEDNYPTTNLEAYACGTPVITYNTGGSVELASKNCIVEKGNVDEIVRIIEKKDFLNRSDLDVSLEKMTSEYMKLYIDNDEPRV